MKNIHLLALLLALSSTMVACRQLTPNSIVREESNEQDFATKLLKLHNSRRYGELTINEHLMKAAQDHANWMAKYGILNHENDREEHAADRVKDANWTSLAENIAEGQKTSAEVFKDWMSSKGHRKNILNEKFKKVGFGMAISKNQTKYWCTVFSD